MTNLSKTNEDLYNDYVLIVENVGEDLAVKNNEPDSIILEGVCAVFGKMNNNKRVYEKEEYLPHLQYLKEKISKRQLTGDLDHPPQFDVTMKSASHIIEDLNYDGNDKVYIKLRILEGTPNGKIAKALINGGVNLSISSRAAGQVLNEGKVRLHRIFTYDLVGEPGFTEAILKRTVNESLKDNFEMITESYNHLKKDSFVEKMHLSEISESLNFADNYKIYKINNKKGLENIFENSIEKQKNKTTMSEFVTRDQMNQYSEVIKTQLENMKKELKEQRNIFESAKPVAVQNDNTELVNFVNYLAEKLEGVINFADYLSGKMNESIKYTEHVAKTTNNAINHQDYLTEKLNQAIGHQDYLAEKLNQTINYAEYLKESLNKSINYQDYLAEELDKSIQYAEYVAEGANAGLEFSDYLAENLNLNREFGNYLAEKVSQGIGYTEYVVESINNGEFKVKRNVLEGVSKLDESTSIESLIEKVDKVITEVTTESASAVLEGRYPFLKVLSDENKKKFYSLKSEDKQAIVETLGAAIWFNEADVLGIMEAVLVEANKNLPNYIKFMPDEYKVKWSKMNESEQNRVHAKAQLYNINTPYQAKSFWDELDFRHVDERIAIEQNNLKMQKLNENNQGTEGMMPVDRVVEMQRGYSQSYLDMLQRNASYRK